MTSESKVLGGVLAATLLIIVGGAFFASSGGNDSLPSEPVAEVERLASNDDPAFFQGKSGAVADFSDAKVTVVEFGDYQCPACGAVHPIFEQLKKDNADKPVRFVFRQFPLTNIHEYSSLAAEGALAAQAQGKFWEYHTVLFANQTKLTRDDLLAYAEDVGLDISSFTKALDEHTFAEVIKQGQTDANIVGVQGTPTFFINGVPYRSQYSIIGFQSAIDAALAQ
jgi:protein-disulfide isomerase